MTHHPTRPHSCEQELFCFGVAVEVDSLSPAEAEPVPDRQRRRGRFLLIPYNGSMLRLLLAISLPLPAAIAQTTAFEQCVAKASRIAGLWEASLNRDQAKLLDPNLRRDRLLLHVQAYVKQSQPAAVLTIPRVDLDSEFPSGRIHRYSMLGQVESERAGVVQFTATREDPKHIALAGTRLLEAERIEATLSIGNDSFKLVFTRPASTFKSPFVGEWVGTFMDETDVFHVHSWSAAQILATYDRIARDWASLGALFLPFQTTDGTLGLSLDSHSTVHVFRGGLIEGGAVLAGDWRGGGMLGTDRFRRSSGPIPQKRD